MAAHVARAGAGGAGHVFKLLKYLALTADMLEASAPPRHAALRRALSALGCPGLPFLALALGGLAAADEGPGDASVEAARAEAARRGVAPHLPKLTARAHKVVSSGAWDSWR